MAWHLFNQINCFFLFIMNLLQLPVILDWHLSRSPIFLYFVFSNERKHKQWTIEKLEMKALSHKRFYYHFPHSNVVPSAITAIRQTSKRSNNCQPTSNFSPLLLDSSHQGSFEKLLVSWAFIYRILLTASEFPYSVSGDPLIAWLCPVAFCNEMASFGVAETSMEESSNDPPQHVLTSDPISDPDKQSCQKRALSHERNTLKPFFFDYFDKRLIRQRKS